MTERTLTLSHGRDFGYTFHYDRGLVVTWTQADAKRNEMAEFNLGEYNWYDD